MVFSTSALRYSLVEYIFIIRDVVVSIVSKLWAGLSEVGIIAGVREIFLVSEMSKPALGPT